MSLFYNFERRVQDSTIQISMYKCIFNSLLYITSFPLSFGYLHIIENIVILNTGILSFCKKQFIYIKWIRSNRIYIYTSHQSRLYYNFWCRLKMAVFTRAFLLFVCFYLISLGLLFCSVSKRMFRESLYCDYLFVLLKMFQFELSAVLFEIIYARELIWMKYKVALSEI